MARTLPLLLAVTACATAASSRFATTGDGSILYFISESRLAGTSQSFSPKLFSWDPSRGVRLVYEEPSGAVCCVRAAEDGLQVAFLTLATGEQAGTARILFTSTGQVQPAAYDPSDGPPDPLPAVPPPSVAVAASRDGTIIYSVTPDNRILRTDLRADLVDVVVAIPFLQPVDNTPAVRGSAFRFQAMHPGDRILANGRELELLSPPGKPPVVQIPWDLMEDPVVFTMQGSGSELEAFTNPVPVKDLWPRAWNAFREDWSASTSASPAAPGEIVHIYATGLGFTDCMLGNNDPAPLDRLCRLQLPVYLEWDDVIPAEVLFAGLAPGLVGIYQIDVRVPKHCTHESLDLSGLIRVRVSLGVAPVG
ncbi:MAG TPA: hypothetical protein VIO38_16275, partial [Rariglobus sp.]